MRTTEHVLNPTGQAVVEIRTEPDPYLAGWSSVSLWDATGRGDEDLLTWEESDELEKFFARYCAFADAQLAPDHFPRPSSTAAGVDPIPDVLATRMLPALSGVLGRIFQDRPGPVPDKWVSIHQSINAVVKDLDRFGSVPYASAEADTLRAAAASLLAAIELPPIPTDDNSD